MGCEWRGEGRGGGGGGGASVVGSGRCTILAYNPVRCFAVLRHWRGDDRPPTRFPYGKQSKQSAAPGRGVVRCRGRPPQGSPPQTIGNARVVLLVPRPSCDTPHAVFTGKHLLLPYATGRTAGLGGTSPTPTSGTSDPNRHRGGGMGMPALLPVSNSLSVSDGWMAPPPPRRRGAGLVAAVAWYHLAVRHGALRTPHARGAARLAGRRAYVACSPPPPPTLTDSEKGQLHAVERLKAEQLRAKRPSLRRRPDGHKAELPPPVG